MKRFLIGALVAYALSATLLVAWWGSKASSLRLLIDDSAIRQAEQREEPFVSKNLRTLFLDQGVDATRWQYLRIRFGDLGTKFFQAVIGIIFVICLVGAIPPRSGPSINATTWVRRSALAASLLGFATVATAWLYGRSPILHPYHLIVVGALAALLAVVAIALVLGFQQLAHGPDRTRVAGWMLVALAPLVFWGFVGAYGARQWQERNVPRNTLMQLSVAAGSALMRLESSYEYLHRLETDRLVMLYNVLDNPHQDGEAMDLHLAEMERVLGKKSGLKVFWVRGRLPVMDLGELSVHEIALGSSESPSDWTTDGRLDRHELAHAALDARRLADADAPSFLLEGWAESQSGATRSELAAKALEQHTEEPSIGIVTLTEPTWYHRADGPVYPLGGAFVEFLIRSHGSEKFLRLYNQSRESRFKHTFREIYDVELEAMEAEFWKDAKHPDA